jgi:uncharacterized protein YidB (DUF937 family)
MGLFDSLAGKLLGGQNADGLGAIMGDVLSGKVDVASSLSGVITSMGGIQGLQEKFQQSGLGDQFASWVSTGENQAVSADQLEQALGGGAGEAANAAKSMGIDLQSVLPMLATLLPGLIDKLTPNGQVNPETAQGPGLEAAIGELMKGGGIGSLLGGGAGGGLGGLLGGFLGGQR